MKPAFVFAVLAMAAPLFAADAPAKKPKARTLQEVIDLALREGKDSTLLAPMAEKFGLGRIDFPEKKLRYKQSETPDKIEHSFLVVLKKNDNGTLSPISLELSYGTGKMVDGNIFVDAVNYRVSLDGKLVKAFHNKGLAGKIDPEELSIKSSSVKQHFKEEWDFHLKKAVELGLAFAR